MVAYSFQKRFAEPILSGQKLHTIRADRKRHARPGEALQLYTGMRTRHCRLIARETCAAVLDVALDLHNERAVVGVGYPCEPRPTGTVAFKEGGSIHGIWLTKRSGLGVLAVKDGFASWDEMRQFWIDTHGMLDEGAVFVGKLIGWWK
ncbi:MAG TPA: ASCH domain-containing protein [Methylocystis sp.]